MYRLIETTGSQLVDENGRPTGPETKQELSRHRTEEAAVRELDRLRRTMPLFGRNCCVVCE